MTSQLPLRLGWSESGYYSQSRYEGGNAVVHPRLVAITSDPWDQLFLPAPRLSAGIKPTRL
jgi:hypothetical protein